MKKIVVLMLILILSLSLCAEALASYGYFSSGLPVIPDVGKAQALEIAESYITAHAPEESKQLDFENGYSINYKKTYPYGYNITYTRIINGILYDADFIYMFVDGSCGEISDFYINFSNDLIFPDEIPLISLDEANRKFVASMGLKLKYNKKIVNNQIQTYLTYSPSSDFLINAQSGNIIVLAESLPADGYFDVTYMAEKTSVYGGTDDSAISVSEADSLVRGVEAFGLTDKYRLFSADYLKSNDGTVLISMLYKSNDGEKSVTIDAVKCVPVEFSDSAAESEPNEFAPREDAVNALAERLYSEYLPSMTIHKSVTEENTVFLWERNVGGIPYNSNGLYISYSNSGKLRSLSFAWDNIVFDSTDGVIDIQYAYNSFFITCGLEKTYYKRENNRLIPVYGISSKGTGIIEAKTGKQLSYDGSVYYLAKDLQYTDIDTHYSKYAAVSLSNCDIYASSGKVELGGFITQKEFLLLISELITDTRPVISTTGMLTDDQCEMLYKYMYSKGVLTEEETGYNSRVTRADAVKYLIRILGYGTVGGMNEIFIRHFTDSYDIPEELAGYAELARSLGIVHGDDYGRFNPKKYITNGDSLILIYNVLRNDEN